MKLKPLYPCGGCCESCYEISDLREHEGTAYCDYCYGELSEESWPVWIDAEIPASELESKAAEIETLESRPVCTGIPRRDCNYLTFTNHICTKCGQVHTLHELLQTKDEVIALREKVKELEGMVRGGSKLTPFGSLCRGWRIELGVLLYDEAKATGMGPAEISGFEFGRTIPTKEQITKIVAYFHDKDIPWTQARRLFDEGILPGAPKESMCSDCPPVGYPTDITRCSECPRAAPKEEVCPK